MTDLKKLFEAFEREVITAEELRIAQAVHAAAQSVLYDAGLDTPVTVPESTEVKQHTAKVKGGGLLTRAEAARAFDMPYQRLVWLEKSGKLHVVRRKGHVLLKQDELRTLVAA